MFTSTHQIRIRYGETDPMGYVYYGNYPTYYEVGRVEALRELDCIYKQLEDEGCLMVVGEMNLKYLKPALYDQLITVKSTISQLPRFGVVCFDCAILDEEGNVLNSGQIKIVCIDKTTRQKMSVPEKLMNALIPYFV